MSVRERETDDLCFCNCTRCQCMHCKCISHKQTEYTHCSHYYPQCSIIQCEYDRLVTHSNTFFCPSSCVTGSILYYPVWKCQFLCLTPRSNHWCESLATYMHIVSQAPQHSKYCETQAACGGCFCPAVLGLAEQTISPVDLRLRQVLVSSTQMVAPSGPK